MMVKLSGLAYREFEYVRAQERRRKGLAQRVLRRQAAEFAVSGSHLPLISLPMNSTKAHNTTNIADTTTKKGHFSHTAQSSYLQPLE